ncbi:MAG: hypothetical protein WBK88_05545, partial [Methanothrix sp.]
RSVADPPYTIDVGRVLLRTAAFCRLRCARRKETGGGCMAAMDRGRHMVPKCVKLPRDVDVAWRDLKVYIATGVPPRAGEAVRVYQATKVKFELPFDYSPVTSC